MSASTEPTQRAKINRWLAKGGQGLRKVRETEPYYAEVGPYYIVDLATNAVAAYGITDLDALLSEVRATQRAAAAAAGTS